MRRLSDVEKGSVLFAIELLARALATDDATAVGVALEQLEATFPREREEV